MRAYVGLYVARLEMPWVKSLKEKRALVRPAIERLRARYPVSAARLEGQNAHTWEVVGLTLIGHDPAWIEEVLEKAAAFLAAQGEYRVAEEGLEVLLWEL